jgi:hypothetical protein
MKNKCLKAHYFSKLCALTLLFVISVFSLANAATPIRPDIVRPTGIQTPGPQTHPNIPGQQTSNSQISNLTVTAPNDFYSGSVVHVNWSWPGHEKDAVDVLLGSKRLASAWTRGAPFSFYVPYDLDTNSYSLRVQSTYNTSNRVSRSVDVKRGYIEIIRTPVKDVSYMQNSLLRTEWTFKGNPGNVKIELYAINNSTPVAMMMPSYSPGSYGTGNFTWTIPANIPNGKYYVSVTSLASSSFSADSPQFYIGKQPAPVIKSVSPQAVFMGGAMTMITDDYRDVASWTAVVELQNGETYPLTLTSISPTQFKFTAPAIYAKYMSPPNGAALLQMLGQTKNIILKKGTATSNKFPINILYAPPILEKISKDTVYPGETIELSGGNWNKDLFYISSQYKIIMELPGASVTNFPTPIAGGQPPTYVQFFPVNILNGKFTINIPEVFCTGTDAAKNATQNGTGKISILSTTFGQSNKLDIKVRKTPVNKPNPYSFSLSPTYAQQSGRTIQYNATSFLPTTNCQKLLITGVKNNNTFPINLAYKKSSLEKFSNYITIAPGQSTSAFNGKDANGQWEAIGPESGSLTGKYYSVSLQVNWRAE